MSEETIGELPQKEETIGEAPQKQETQLPPITDPKMLHLFFDPPGTLRLTVGEDWGAYSYAVVRLYQAAPLSLPNQYFSLQDGKGEEIGMVKCLDEFDSASQPVVQEEIRRRYLTATIQQIITVKTEFGITYWTVQTDRGERDFVVQSLSDSCIWLSETHILLIDVDGNRFEIPNRNALDEQSQTQLAVVL
jgi:hypothetical protein